MDEARPFLDTNVLLYLLSEDEAKANRSEQLLAAGGVISVQVLNEFAHCMRKLLVIVNAMLASGTSWRTTQPA